MKKLLPLNIQLSNPQSSPSYNFPPGVWKVLRLLAAGVDPGLFGNDHHTLRTDRLPIHGPFLDQTFISPGSHKLANSFISRSAGQPHLLGFWNGSCPPSL